MESVLLGKHSCVPFPGRAYKSVLSKSCPLESVFSISKDTFVRLSHKTDSNIGTHICVPFPILKQRSMNNVANFAEIIYGSSQTRPAGRDLVDRNAVYNAAHNARRGLVELVPAQYNILVLKVVDLI